VEDKLKGYKGKSIDLLKKYTIEIWDIIQITTNKTKLEGIVMPRSEYSAPDFIEIKLENNYNVGINVSEIQNIKKIGKREANYKLPEKEFPYNKDLPLYPFSLSSTYFISFNLFDICIFNSLETISPSIFPRTFFITSPISGPMDLIPLSLMIFGFLFISSLIIIFKSSTERVSRCSFSIDCSIVRFGESAFNLIISSIASFPIFLFFNSRKIFL